MDALRTILGRGALLVTLLCGACAETKTQPIVTSNDVFPGDLPTVDRELSSRESQRVIDAMASTRRPQDISEARPFETSPKGRWSEVPLAAILGSKFVEMAVVNWVVEPDGVRFTIVALNNDAGELLVKGDPMHGVTSATATLGLFDERPQDADLLVESFYSHLHTLGAVPRPAPMPQTASMVQE
ncbi:MAG: hypothetical protein K8R92_00210 [Planctomycetes bacterium]|nr:hypothetical protein [Planctomycetota bacterium]